MRRRTVFLMVLPAVIVAVGGAMMIGSSPETVGRLPAVDLSAFEPAVQEQVAAAAAAATGLETAESAGDLGRVLHAYGQYAAAAQAYARARTLAPDAFAWHYLHGRALMELGDNAQALRALKAATEARPDYLPAWLAVAEILLVTERSDVAAGVYRSLLEYKPDSPVIHYGLGRSLTKTGDTAGAIEHLERAVALADYFAAAHYQLALLHRDRGERDKADKYLDRHRRHKGKRPAQGDPLLQQVQALNLGSRQVAVRGKAALIAGDLNLAAELFEQSVAQDRTFAGAHAALVFVYWRLGDGERAEAHYRKAIEIDPKNPEAYLNYGMLIATGNDLEQAVEMFGKAIAADPGNATAHTFLGYVRDQQGLADEAMAHYRAALTLEPNQPRANYLVGRQLLVAGEAEKAASHFEAAVADGGPGSQWFLRQIAAAYTEVGEPERARPYQEQAERMTTAADSAE